MFFGTALLDDGVFDFQVCSWVTFSAFSVNVRILGGVWEFIFFWVLKASKVRLSVNSSLFTLLCQISKLMLSYSTRPGLKLD